MTMLANRRVAQYSKPRRTECTVSVFACCAPCALSSLGICSLN